MRNAIIGVILVVAMAGFAYAGDQAAGLTGQERSIERTTIVLDLFNDLMHEVRGPGKVYQVPAIIVPRELTQREQYEVRGYVSQPFAGYFSAQYLADYKDATNAIVVVKGNIQILLPNDGYPRTCEQEGNKIIITNTVTGKTIVMRTN